MKTTPLNPMIDILRRQTIISKLLTLKLKRIADIIDEALTDFAHENPADPENLLERLLDAQLQDNTERMIGRRLKEARFPERKTMMDFDFSFQPDLDKRLIFELATLRLLQKRQGLILAGNSGTGKSHLAIALGIEACKRGVTVLYTTAAEMLSDLYSALADDTLEQKLKRYVRPTLLIVDELGFDRLEQENARNAALFFKVVDARYQTGSTFYTTNIDFEALGHYLGDPVVTTAIVDRMVHRSTVITLTGPSYRLKQSRELNADMRTPQSPPTDQPQKPATRSKTRTTSAS
jgi:DNA replication protein DnaC